jgi:hypothetical protein
VYCSSPGLLNSIYVAAVSCDFVTDHTTQHVSSRNALDNIEEVPGWNAGRLTSCHELWFS